MWLLSLWKESLDYRARLKKVWGRLRWNEGRLWLTARAGLRWVFWEWQWKHSFTVYPWLFLSEMEPCPLPISIAFLTACLPFSPGSLWHLLGCLLWVGIFSDACEGIALTFLYLGSADYRSSMSERPQFDWNKVPNSVCWVRQIKLNVSSSVCFKSSSWIIKL